MEERFVPLGSGEGRPIETHEAKAGADPRQPLDDPRALQILSTEHWSLLTARSLVYNEAFARGGMFMAFLSATLVVLGLISTATGFSDPFLVVVAVVLALDLFVGLATLGRIAAASSEDLRYLQGMNRLRHAYHEMVPGLERYFISSHNDDFDSVARFYGPISPSAIAGVLHGFTTTPGMLATICSGVAGGLVAVVVLLFTHEPVLAGVAGLLGVAAFFMTATAIAMRSVLGFMTSMEPIFPKPPDDPAGPANRT